jgi:hypothetical protein
VLDFANKAEDIQEAFAPFFEQSSAAPTDPNLLYTLQRIITDAKVIHPDEQAARRRGAAIGRGGEAEDRLRQSQPRRRSVQCPRR